MIWADRVGIGLVAITVVIFVSLWGAGALTREPVFQFAWSTHRQEATPALQPGKLYTDEDLGIDQRSSEPATIWDAIEDARRSSLLFVVPLWLVLRIVDFMAGGPDRRRRGRLASGLSGAGKV